MIRIIVKQHVQTGDKIVNDTPVWIVKTPFVDQRST